MSEHDETASETDPAEAIEAFLHAADDAYTEYERGYTDADATLRRLEGAIETLREATDDE